MVAAGVTQNPMGVQTYGVPFDFEGWNSAASGFLKPRAHVRFMPRALTLTGKAPADSGRPGLSRSTFYGSGGNVLNAPHIVLAPIPLIEAVPPLYGKPGMKASSANRYSGRPL